MERWREFGEERWDPLGPASAQLTRRLPWPPPAQRMATGGAPSSFSISASGVSLGSVVFSSGDGSADAHRREMAMAQEAHDIREKLLEMLLKRGSTVGLDDELVKDYTEIVENEFTASYTWYAKLRLLSQYLINGQLGYAADMMREECNKTV